QPPSTELGPGRGSSPSRRTLRAWRLRFCRPVLERHAMSHHEEAPRRMPRLWISALAIAVAAMLPFSAALGADFVYDDFVLIVRNELVRGFKLAELWTTQFFHNSPTIHFQYFRPLVTTSFAIDWSLW